MSATRSRSGAIGTSRQARRPSTVPDAGHHVPAIDRDLTVAEIVALSLRARGPTERAALHLLRQPGVRLAGIRSAHDRLVQALRSQPTAQVLGALELLAAAAEISRRTRDSGPT